MKFIFTKTAYITAIFLMFLINSALANTSIQCDNCMNPKAAAISAAGFDGGIYQINVLDFKQEKILTYRVRVMDSMEMESGFSVNSVTASLVTTSQYLQESFNQWIQNTKNVKARLEDSVVPASVLASAWDLYGRSANSNQLISWIYNNPTLEMRMIDVFNIGVSIFKVADVNFSVPIILTLQNGAKISIVYSGVAQDGEIIKSTYAVDFKKSTDKDGNSIILKTAQESNGETGSFLFADSGGFVAARFIYAAELGGFKYGATSGWRVRCVLIGKTLSCTLHKN